MNSRLAPIDESKVVKSGVAIIEVKAPSNRHYHYLHHHLSFSIPNEVPIEINESFHSEDQEDLKSVKSYKSSDSVRLRFNNSFYQAQSIKQPLTIIKYHNQKNEASKKFTKTNT